MISILDLWMPIALASVLVFVVSSLLHMVFTYHRADYKALPREADIMAALRSADLAPGLYMFPYSPSAKEGGSPAMQEKFRQGPVGMLTLRPSGVIKLGGFLGAWFAYTLLIGAFVAYLAGLTLPSGAPYMQVFRVVGTAAFLAYGVGPMIDSIWKSIPWSNTLRATLDGLLYALVTAGTFGWLWPR